MPTRPKPPVGVEREEPCAACGRSVPARQATACASCGKRVCRLCVRWYGHYMLVCEECRTAEW